MCVKEVNIDLKRVFHFMSCAGASWQQAEKLALFVFAPVIIYFFNY
jgi:hypothetical protein